MWPFNKLIDWACAESEADKFYRECRNSAWEENDKRRSELEEAYPLDSTFEYLGAEFVVLGHCSTDICYEVRGLFYPTLNAELKCEFRDNWGMIYEKIFTYEHAMRMTNQCLTGAY